MAAKVYLKLSNSEMETEVGPFDSISIKPSSISVDESATQCAVPDATTGGEWYISDGSELGDERLTGQVFPVILGQAKLVE